MKNQIIKKAREIFKDLEFVEDSHTYTVKGKVLPSTSSMIKQFYKPFDADRVAFFVARKRGITKEEVLKEWQ